ncbi:methyl-accepting chemotaxis protein [Paenibacillus sp. 481]|uniref:methyl-accepting chemotaxis protein n=1 Tax=Paenibacillus sp. 481 TaxID=2835869 RepID=UPI001E4A5CF6|nr:methyl-accepting chemotaxis protein [Paenibacillus sp. 481]UHA74295.1 methyl-accepting chemotaxis protein [Paenibacillus sp. 481]
MRWVLLRKQSNSPLNNNKFKVRNLQWHPARSVGTRLFLLFFIGITVLVGSIGLFSFNQSRTIIEQEMSMLEEAAITQLGDKLDIMFNNYVDLSNQILFDQDLQKALSLTKTNTAITEYEKLQRMTDVEKNLKALVFGNDSVFSLLLIPVEESYGPIYTSGLAHSMLGSLRNESWFKQAVQKEGSVVWVPTSEKGLSQQGPKETFALARTVKNVSSGNTYMLVTEIYADSLQEHMEWKTGVGGFAQLVSAEGNLVISHNKELIGQAPPVQLVADGEKTGRQSVTNKEGQELLGVYYKSSITNWTLNGFIPVDELLAGTAAIRNMTLLSIGVALLIAILMGWYVMRSIGRPLKRMRDLMEEGAQGQLGLRMAVQSKDEIGEVAASFNTMMSRIGDLVQRTGSSAQSVMTSASKLSDASRQTAQAARDIALATEEIASGATGLAAEAERGNEWTDHTANQVAQVVQLNAAMFQAATEVENASKRGTSYMDELNDKTAATEQIVHSLVSKVDALKDSTSSARNILDVLTQLAKQTNILSLNAAIEAARAGAAGKGFMVVADEIRKLADQSKQSIEIVGSITENIQREVNETVRMLGDANPIFREQADAVKEADIIFRAVHVQMGTLMTKLDGATSAVHDLSETQSALNEAIANVSAVAEQSSATSEEVASLSSEQMSVSARLVNLSNELEQVSLDLQERLSRFTFEQLSADVGEKVES